LDHMTTSLATVWREVETRANAAGVRVLRGELIGLIPLDAVLQVAADSLKLDGFTRDRVIESHFLEEVMEADVLKRVLEALNRHDLDAIMSFFTDDCVLEMPRGPAA